MIRFALPHKSTLLWVPLFLVFIVLSAARLGHVQSYLWVDTEDFIRSSRAPILSATFLAGRRAPLLPLLLKLVDRDLNRLYVAQVALSVGAWIFLALVLWPSLRRFRPLLICTILALGLSSQVALWNYAPLSESISNSISIVLIGLSVLLMRQWKWWTFAAVVFTAALWTAARDTNTVEITLSVVAIVVAVIFGAPRRYLLLCAALILVLLVSGYSANRGRNWIHATWNILVHRILPSEEATRYFTDHGMPMTPLLKKQQSAPVNDGVFYAEPELQPFLKWWQVNSRRTYATFLMTHPGWLFGPMFLHTREMYGPPMDVYESTGFHTRWRQTLSRVAYPEGWPFGIFILICLGCAVFASRRESGWWLQQNRLVPAALVVLGLTVGLCNYHFDAREVGRHAVNVNLHLRLGLWILFAQALETLFQTRNSLVQ